MWRRVAHLAEQPYRACRSLDVDRGGAHPVTSPSRVGALREVTTTSTTTWTTSTSIGRSPATCCSSAAVSPTKAGGTPSASTPRTTRVSPERCSSRCGTSTPNHRRISPVTAGSSPIRSPVSRVDLSPRPSFRRSGHPRRRKPGELHRLDPERLFRRHGDRLPARTVVGFVGRSGTLAVLDPCNSPLIDGVLVANTDRHHAAGLLLKISVDQPEGPSGTAWDVELDAGEPGQVAADVPHSKELAGDPSVCEVVECGASCVHHMGAVNGECLQIVCNCGMGA